MQAHLRTRTRAGFLTIDAHAEPGDRAIVDGRARIPALAVRRVRLYADASHIAMSGPELPVLVRYVIDTLRRDVGGELPVN